jgi:hypothetical protein
MSKARREAVLGLERDRGCELWSRKLEQIPSLFARLIFLSGLRARGGKYRDGELAKITSPRIADQIIRDAYCRTFRTWLALGIRAKVADLKPYLICTGAEDPHSLLSISFSRLCRDLLPPKVSINELAMFSETVQTVLKLLVDLDNR